MKTLTIAPLSVPGALTDAVRACLFSAPALYLQTVNHPCAAAVLQAGVPFVSMDDLYDSAEDFDALNRSIADRLTSGGSAVYAVMGNSCFTQLPSIEKACNERGFNLIRLPGVSYAEAAFPGCTSGTFIPANELTFRPDVTLPLYVSEIASASLAGDVKNTLQEVYPDDWEITLAVQRKTGEYRLCKIKLFELDRQTDAYFASTVAYIPKLSFDNKYKYTFDDLLYVMERLRAPGGCPWDRAQTRLSLNEDLRDECFELMDAVNEDDDAHIAEESGDVLMQVAFQAVIGKEMDVFNDLDITDGVVRKLIYRHPHVFNNGSVKDVEDVLQKWEALKRKEKGLDTLADSLKSVPKGFPALLRAQKVQHKAAKAGLEYLDTHSFRSLAERPEATQNELDEKTLGDLLFDITAVCRSKGFDAETLLHEASERFIDRFARTESAAVQAGQNPETLSKTEWQKLWHSADAGSFTEIINE